MPRRIIAIDCDDVIVGTATAILNNYNQAFGTNMQLKDFYSHDLSVWNAPNEQTAIDRVDEYLKTDEYQRMPPFQEAIAAIAELNKHHELHIVTGRSDFLAKATEDMLGEYFPQMFRSIEFTNFYGKQPRPKSLVCQQLGADLLIDDHLHHATIVAECGIEAYLFGSYPWNQADKLPPNITRMPNWPSIVASLT